MSLALALTFGFYGLIRKKASVAALPGLVVETWLLPPLALVWLLFFADGPTSETAFWSTPEALWMVATDPMALVPLVCFNAAARHLPYATLDFPQYLAPALVLLQMILLFGRHLDSSRLTAFALIWPALAVYSFGAWRSLRRLPQPG